MCIHLPGDSKKPKKPPQGEPGHSEEGLTAKQLQAKLKREANKLSKEEAKKARKEEAEQKKAAKATTRKVVQLSSKLSVPLTQAVQKAQEILQKADQLGLKDHEEVKNFKACVDIIEDWKKKCSNAIAFYSKNPTGELAALPFTSDKDVFNSLKDLTKKGNELKTAVINPAQKEQSSKKWNRKTKTASNPVFKYEHLCRCFFWLDTWMMDDLYWPLVPLPSWKWNRGIGRLCAFGA